MMKNSVGFTTKPSPWGSTRSSKSTTRGSSDRAVALEDAIIGINNRDLDTLETDRGRVLGLLPSLPPERIVVAESGYLEPAHLAELRGRADGVLIGTALMRASDPSVFLRAASGGAAGP